MGFFSWLKGLFVSSRKVSTVQNTYTHFSSGSNYSRSYSNYNQYEPTPSISLYSHSIQSQIVRIEEPKVQTFLQMQQLDDFPLPEKILQIESEENPPSELLVDMK